MMREWFGGDHDRRCGIGDPLAEATEFCVIEQMRVVGDDRRGRIVAVPGRPRQHRDPGLAQRRSDGGEHRALTGADASRDQDLDRDGRRGEQRRHGVARSRRNVGQRF